MSTRRLIQSITRITAIAMQVACGMLLLSGPAHAQLIQEYFPTDIPGYTPDFSSSVLNRKIMAEQSNGVEVGDFVIRPQLTENVGYNSNTLAIANSGSSQINTKAGVRADSDWGRNELDASFNVDDLRYPSEPVASYTNWTASVGGSRAIGDDRATLAFSHLNLHLAATDLGAVGVVEPVPYTINDVRASYLTLFGRFSVTPSFEYQDLAYGQAGGVNSTSYDTLSHQTESGGITARFEQSPGDAAVLILQAAGAQFHDDPINNYLDLAGFAGLDYQADRVIRYRLLVGLESRHFSDGVNKTDTVPTFELDALWTPTQLDTVTATGVHRLEAPTSPYALNQSVLDGRIQLDHELRRNLFLDAFTEVARSNSTSAGINASDNEQTQLNLGIGATWIISRHLSGELSYSYYDSVSHGSLNTASTVGSSAPNFTSSIVYIGISLFE
jgi:hypothetical protein